MPSNQPIPPTVRLAIIRWPEDAPRGAVTAFCEEHHISRKSFYAVRARVREESPIEALAPRSRRPQSSPSRTDEVTLGQALQVRAALEASGLDFGPISVMDKMRLLGMAPPSRATLARHFVRAGVVIVEPRKKPRSAYRRFVYPAPNCLWQLDATEYVLSGGRVCVIFQLIDDHARFAVASHVAWAETSDAAIVVVKKGIAAHGVPQKFLSDNGAALNPTRRGFHGQLVAYLSTLGVAAITGKPGKPTTQGKNERFHRTLFRWLDKQPFADTLAQLQEQVDEFDHIYNTQRPHQSLAGRVTPLHAWEATPKAAPPRPQPPDDLPAIPADKEGHTTRTVDSYGGAWVHRTRFMLGRPHAGRRIHAIWDLAEISFYDDQGTHIISHPRPRKGTIYVGNGKPRGHRTSPMS